MIGRTRASLEKTCRQYMGHVWGDVRGDVCGGGLGDANGILTFGEGPKNGPEEPTESTGPFWCHTSFEK